MRKRRAICFMLSVCLLLGSVLTGCGTDEEQEVFSTIQESNLPQLFESDVDFDYESKAGNDAPIYMRDMSVTPTEDGYYYMQGDYLKFFDKSTEKSVFVCTQVTCGHEDEGCDAYFDLRSNRTEQGIWYYDDKLYYIGTGESRSDYALWNMNLDGTDRAKVTDLFKAEGENDFLYAMTIHRGYMYYALSNMDFLEPACIYQVELKQNAKPAVVYTSSDKTTNIYRFKAYGNGIFFQEGFYPNGDIETEGYSASVNYLTDNGECYRVLEGPQKFYNIIDGKLFYTTNDGEIRFYDWNTNIEQSFVQGKGIADLSFDSKYIYTDNNKGVLFSEELENDEREIVVYDRQGNVVHTFAIPRHESEDCLWGDEDYLWMVFAICDDEGGWYGQELKAYNKKQLETKENEWTTVETTMYNE